MPDLVIKNARLVLPSGIVEGGIVVEDGRILDIKKSSLPKASDTIDANGNYVLPGLIDAHVHFREPGASSKEDWSTGSKAALVGGITTVLDMPNTQPPTTTLKHLEEKRGIVSSKAMVDYGFHFGASSGNIEELRNLEGVASVKFYMSSTTGSLISGDDPTLLEELGVLADRKIPATVHAENRDMVGYWMEKVKAKDNGDPSIYAESRPEICVAEAANKIVLFSKKTGARVHLCHMSTRDELSLLEQNKGGVTGEVCPHHLFLTKESMKSLKAYGKTNPPLRSEETRRALLGGVRNGVIDIIASDHAPHLPESKEKNIWEASAGVPGVETTLPLLLNEVNKGRLKIERIAEMMAENPARIFGIQNKGRIEKGYDADFVIIDLDRESKVENEHLFTKCKWSPFNGWELKGWPTHTILRGALVFDDGILNPVKGKEVRYG